ncbi:MAG: methyltransferase domain-containing protein [Eubacteriales bacterium]|nr:methyltransferase domain-containing protein [Eubacteriales bacterium]
MEKRVLFTIKSPYRQSMEVCGWFFGNPDKETVAVMGALRGNEVQQMFICSRLIQRLKTLEDEGKLSPDAGILVIPCANQFSMNVGKRFWASDNTDINRMFPGYELGETTQRIAGRLFKCLQGYKYGIHLVSLYLPSDITPHIKIMSTGYEQTYEADAFGLPYVITRDPVPFDTTTLNYNWQVWDTQAFSLYTRETDHVDIKDARRGLFAILRFLYAKGITTDPVADDVKAPVHFNEGNMQALLSEAGGLLLLEAESGDHVTAGQTLGKIFDPCDGSLLQTFESPSDGRVFFTHHADLIDGHEIAFRIVPDEAVEGDPSRPDGEPGVRMLKRMNDSHAPLRKWGFAHIDWHPGMRILDIGCGGGATIAEMAALAADSKISGIDYQKTSVDLTAETNRELIGTRVDVRQADAADIPYDDGTFDLVTAVETVYFWPDLSEALKDIMRVLKPGGQLAILNDASNPDEVDWPDVSTGLTIYTPRELTRFLEEAGFSDINMDVAEDGQMLAATARKA